MIDGFSLSSEQVFLRWELVISRKVMPEKLIILCSNLNNVWVWRD